MTKTGLLRCAVCRGKPQHKNPAFAYRFSQEGELFWVCLGCTQKTKAKFNTAEHLAEMKALIEEGRVEFHVKPFCLCGHHIDYHPTIAGSRRRHACGKVGCNCTAWRPIGETRGLS